MNKKFFDIAGNIAQDIEVKTSKKADGTEMSVAKFNVAINNGDGKNADFIRLIAFDKTAETISKYYKKGDEINAVGNIKIGQYTDKDGKKVNSTDFIIDHIVFDVAEFTVKGRLVKDPEIKTSENGKSSVRFGVAVNNGKDKDGKEKAPTFVYAVAFGKTAEFIAKYFTKGSGIVLNGKLSNDKYTNKEGKEVSSTSFIANTVDFWGRKKKSDAEKEEAAADPDTESDEVATSDNDNLLDDLDSIDI